MNVNSFSQNRFTANFGGSIGLVASIGTGFDRLGVCFKGYYKDGPVQVNADLRFYCNVKNLGPPGFYPEGFASVGIIYGYGKKDTLDKNPFLSTVSNQTGLPNSVGYSYNFYFNTIGTSQRTGTLAFQFNKVTFIGEDDLFASAGKDKYRTGAFLIQYNYNNLVQWAVNCAMWTGKMGFCNKHTDYPYPNGYVDTTGGKYCNYSHGLVSLQAKSILPMFGSEGFKYIGQEAQLNLGIDAEQVRNMVQNRLVHDMIFLPEKWRSTKNCHIPMLDNKGNEYLYKPDQKIRKPKAYVNGFLNPLLFY